MPKHTYIAEFEPAPEGGYGIHFPDLPGCTSFAESLNDAPDQAQEALSIHLAGMNEDGDPLPHPRGLGEIVAEEEAAPGGLWSAVTVDLPEGQERVNVYLPKSLLAQIDLFGQTSGIDNRSTFFRLAARAFLRKELASVVYAEPDVLSAGDMVVTQCKFGEPHFTGATSRQAILRHGLPGGYVTDTVVMAPARAARHPYHRVTVESDRDEP